MIKGICVFLLILWAGFGVYLYNQPDAVPEVIEWPTSTMPCSVLTGERVQVIRVAGDWRVARVANAHTAATFGVDGNTRYATKSFYLFELETCQ